MTIETWRKQNDRVLFSIAFDLNCSFFLRRRAQLTLGLITIPIGFIVRKYFETKPIAKFSYSTFLIGYCHFSFPLFNSYLKDHWMACWQSFSTGIIVHNRRPLYWIVLWWRLCLALLNFLLSPFRHQFFFLNALVD